MGNNIDIEILDFQANIIKVVEESKLSPLVLKLALSDVYMATMRTIDNMILKNKDGEK